jgi:two-component system sensor histidine kinase UhpB
MEPRRRSDRNILWVLGAGFALVIAALLASGYLGIQAMERSEARVEALVRQQRAATGLIDEIQSEEAGLSNLFYSVASNPSPGGQRALLQTLDEIEQDIERTLAAAASGPGAAEWSAVRVAVKRLVQELRATLQSAAPPSAELYHRHETLVNELARLTSSNFQEAVSAQENEHRRSRTSLRNALVLLYLALAVSVICAIATVRMAGHVFRRLDWQTRELSRLSAHVLETQETIVRRFSHELHDELGQTLSAIQANLAAVPRDTPEAAARIEDCRLLVNDAIGNVRQMSQLLRPSMLDDFGLAPSLRWLAQSFSQRTGIEVKTEIDFDDRLPEGVETHLFRIAQEALTNVARHSGASNAELGLRARDGVLRLTVGDNGHGFANRAGGPTFGLIGMRERMAASGGSLSINSTAKGTTVTADVSLEWIYAGPAHSNSPGR